MAKAKLRAMWSSTRRQQQFRAMVSSRRSYDGANFHHSIRTVFLFPCLAHVSVGVGVVVLAKRGVTVREERGEKEDGKEYQYYRWCLHLLMSSVGGIGDRPFLAAPCTGNRQVRVGPSRWTMHSVWNFRVKTLSHHESFPVVTGSKFVLSEQQAVTRDK